MSLQSSGLLCEAQDAVGVAKTHRVDQDEPDDHNQHNGPLPSSGSRSNDRWHVPERQRIGELRHIDAYWDRVRRNGCVRIGGEGEFGELLIGDAVSGDKPYGFAHVRNLHLHPEHLGAHVTAHDRIVAEVCRERDTAASGCVVGREPVEC